MWKQRKLKILSRPKVRASKHRNLTPSNVAPKFTASPVGRFCARLSEVPVLAHKDATWNSLSFLLHVKRGKDHLKDLEGQRPHLLGSPSPSSSGPAVKKEAQRIFAEGSKTTYGFEMTVFFTYSLHIIALFKASYRCYLQNNYMRRVLFLVLLHRWGNQGTESVNNLPKSNQSIRMWSLYSNSGGLILLQLLVAGTTTNWEAEHNRN